MQDAVIPLSADSRLSMSEFKQLRNVHRVVRGKIEPPALTDPNTLRVYRDAPGTAALQIRFEGRVGFGDATRRFIAHASLTREDLAALRAQLDLAIADLA